jgi:hypothetical protein
MLGVDLVCKSRQHCSDLDDYVRVKRVRVMPFSFSPVKCGAEHNIHRYSALAYTSLGILLIVHKRSRDMHWLSLLQPVLPLQTAHGVGACLQS